MPDPIVFVVDDDVSVRRSLDRLIGAAGFSVETFDSAEAFLNHDHPECPACLVLDLRMPGLSGLELQRRLATAGRDVPIVFITGHGTVPASVRAMKDGALDFIEKPFEAQTLLDAVKNAIRKDAQALKERTERQEIERRLASLTPREREVAALLVTGMLNKRIADRLGTSEKTVKVHRGRVMHKMQVKSVAELVHLAEKVPFG